MDLTLLGHELYFTLGKDMKKRKMYDNNRGAEYILKVLIKSVKSCAPYVPLKKTQI